MSRLRLLMRTLSYFRLANLAVTLSVAVGTAVLAGSLIVGDSVRDSLAEIVEKRLGDIDHVLLAPHFFRDSLAARLRELRRFSKGFCGAEAALVSSASCTEPESGAIAARVNVFGRASVPPGSCAVSSRLARQLKLQAGKTMVLRMDPLKHVASDLPVGAGRGEVAILRLRVVRVAERGGFEDAFSFYGTQRPVRNVWVPLKELQSALDAPGRANVLFVSAEETHEGEEGSRVLQELLGQVISLEDYGLKLVKASRNELSLESHQLLLSRAVERAVRRALPGARLVLAYVANAVADIETGREFPYSMVAGIDELPDGPVPEGGVVLNRWAADDLKAKPADRVEVSYVVRGPGGLPEERSARFVLDRVIETSGVGADSSLVPEFKGVTDAGSLSAWHPPRDFEFHPERIRKTDEEYWKRFGASPKAFIDIATAQELWGTDSGSLTSMRFSGIGERELRRRLPDALAVSAGLVWRPIRSQQVRAASGGTDFGQLFLGFSIFLAASAALLVLLVMRLSVEQRTRQIGVMFATGFTAARIRTLFLAEGLVVLAAGSALGALGSAGYAWLMLTGLKTVWSDALGTTLVELSLGKRTILLGCAGGFIVGAVAVWRGIGRIGRMRVVRALSGRRAEEGRVVRGRGFQPVAAGLFVAAMVVVLAALVTERLNTTAAFFIGGVCLLAAFLAALRAWLARIRSRKVRPGRMALGWRNAARNPHRSMLTSGLLASASFIMVAVGSMKASSTRTGDPPPPGGYALVAEFDVPVPYDMNLKKGRGLLAVGGGDELWRGVRFANMRTGPGEDASWRNLFRPTSPRVTSVPERLVKEGAFPFASHLGDVENPWELLDAPLPDGAVPAVADYETARWIVHKRLGDALTVSDERGAGRSLRIVALLRKSIFQGEILVSERSFRELFPSRSGYGQILIATRPEDSGRVKSILSRDLADFGVTVESTAERLSSFTRIADSYISAFEALGGLGLLLGSLGLVVVLIRGVIERRSEIALLSALGFGPGHVALLVSAENSFLLLSGMLAGTVSALFAVAPEFVRSGGRIGSVGLTLGFFCCIVAAIALFLTCVSATMVRRVSPASLRLE